VLEESARFTARIGVQYAVEIEEQDHRGEREGSDRGCLVRLFGLARGRLERHPAAKRRGQFHVAGLTWVPPETELKHAAPIRRARRRFVAVVTDSTPFKPPSCSSPRALFVSSHFSREAERSCLQFDPTQRRT
jgi:hypothetical protein